MTPPLRVFLSAIVVFVAVGRVVAQAEKKPPDAAKQIAEQIEVLKDKDDRELAQRAFLALGPDGPYAKKAVPFLIDALDAKDADHRGNVAAILAEYGTPAVPSLILALKRREASVRLGAAEALFGIRPRAVDAIPALIDLLKDDVPEVRRQAATSLQVVGRSSDKPIAPLSAALKDKDDGMRGTAAWALGHLGRRAAPAVPNLIAAMKDNEKDVRDEAIVALGDIGPPAKAAVPALVEALENQKVDYDRYQIAVALGSIGPAAKEAVPALLEMLRHDDAVGLARRFSNPQYAAIVALRTIGPDAKAAVAQLLKIAKDKNDDARYVAISALGGIGPDAKAAIPTMIEVLETRPKKNEDNRSWAVNALADMGPEAKDAIPKLMALARDLSEDRPLRKAAAKAVLRIDPELAAKEKMEFAHLNVRLGKTADLKPAARAAITEARKKEIKALIAKLAEINEPDFGLSGSVNGVVFAPLPGQEKFQSGVLGGPRLKPSDAFRRLVEIGPDALPFLLDALDDATPTGLKVEHRSPIGGMGFDDGIKSNPLNPIERRVLSKKAADDDADDAVLLHKYQLRIGDVCFVAIGQIVGRPYYAVRYIPTAMISISSPVESKMLRDRVRAIWASDDPAKKLLDSLLLDYATEGLYNGESLDGWYEGSDFQIRAALRLLYYFPKEAAPLIADRLKAFDVRDADGDAWMKREVKNGVRAVDFIKAAAWCREPSIREALADIAKQTDDKQIKALLSSDKK